MVDFYSIHVGKYTMNMDPLGRELDFVENVGSLNEPVRPMEPFSISIGGILSKLFLWKKNRINGPFKKTAHMIVSKKSPTGPTERTPKKPDYLVALDSSNLLRGPLV